MFTGLLFHFPSVVNAQILNGDDLFLTDPTPGIVFDDTDTDGPNWAIRGRDEFFNIDDEASSLTYLRFDPAKFSTALGQSASAPGDFSTALGGNAFAAGAQSTALGPLTNASGDRSTAVGSFATASVTSSSALGDSAIATGISSTALGSFAKAAGANSTALGFRATAPNPSTIVLGSTPNINSANSYMNIGMGTTAPVEAVDVERSAAAARFQLTSFTADATEAPQYIQRRARGTRTVPTAVQNNDNLGLFSFRGYNGTVMGGSRATITAQAAGNFSGTSTPTRLIFATTPVGQTAPQPVLVITPDGKVQVKGVNLNVPDYVFEDDYQLMPLDELKAFIETNRHLPGIPSADEVNSGVHDLAGSDMAHLRKIEELTLYALQQESRLQETRQGLQAVELRNQVLEAKNAQLEQRLASLESRIPAR
jgi:hypothetical protein